MPTDAELDEIELLADLLDGRIDPSQAPAELAQLVDLAGQVRTHVGVPLPTDAFREALRDQVVQAVASPATGVATITTTTATAAGSGGAASIVAAVAATAVLLTSTVTAADRAGPGDLLSGLDRGIESVQLSFVGDAGRPQLLVDLAAERVLEALPITDTAVVTDLLAEAESLVAEALDLAAARALDVDELLAPYTGALLTLSSRTEDPIVEARLSALLDDLGAAPLQPAPSTPATSGTDDGPDGATDEEPTTGSTTPPATDQPAPGVDDPEVLPDEVVPDITDPVDELPDLPVDPTELPDPTDPLDDALDDVGDAVDDLLEPLGP